MAHPAKHILISGPTASGKSALALELADRLGATVMNADALQVYDSWQVLTARPDDADLARAPHRLYGHVSYETPYSVGHWLRDVEAYLNGPERLIFVGGTGLYLSSLVNGLPDIPATPEDLRRQSNIKFTNHGIHFFTEYLSQNDPQYMEIVDQNNHVRLQRAWEVQELTGKPMSWWRTRPRKALIDVSQSVRLNLVSSPAWLNERISHRFDRMMDGGALDEARAILPRWDPDLPASKALGAAELIAHLNGRMDQRDAVEQAKIATRQFAKRQRTWFRSNMKDWRQIDWDGTGMVQLVDQIVSAG